MGYGTAAIFHPDDSVESFLGGEIKVYKKTRIEVPSKALCLWQRAGFPLALRKEALHRWYFIGAEVKWQVGISKNLLFAVPYH